MTYRHGRAAALTLSTAVGLALTAPAFAQSASTPGVTTDKASTTLGEVVVTAEKRSELASRTPVALTAVTGADLKASGVVNVSDLSNVVPAVTIGRDGFGVNINIRGVTTTDTTSKGEQGIAFNVDNIPIGRPSEQGLSFFDVQRVEVLRGPQGTLYGKSSTGGVINVITNKPTDAFAASGDVEFGNYGARRGNAVVNVPVNDMFAFRVAGNFNQRDGYLETSDGSPNRGDQSDASGRFTGLIKFTPDINLTATLTGGHVGGVGPGTALMSRVMGGSGDSQLQVLGNPFGAHLSEDYLNFNTELNASVGPVHVTYDGGHLMFHADDFGSSTNDPLANYQGPPPASATYNWREYRGRVLTDSHEIRVSNDEPGRVEWVVGANWVKEKIRESDHNWSAPATNATLAGSRNGIDPLNTTTHVSKGLFGQATFHVTEQLGLVAGVRRSTDEVVRIGTFAAGPGPWRDPTGAVCVAPNDCVGGPNNGNQSASKTTYRLGVNFQATPTQLFYGSIATGYKAGGFNDFDPTTGGVGTYEPEDLVAYEIGYKGRPTNWLRLNSDVFYYDYKKAQISSLVNISGNFVIYTRSAPTKIMGWENEFTAAISPNDQIDGSLVLEKSRYESFNAGLLQNVDWSGYSLDKTPRAVATLGYNHIWDLDNGASVRVRVATKYSSSYKFSDIVDALQFTQKAYSRTDANLTYTAPDAKFYVQGFVKNLENKVQALGYGGSYSPTLVNGATVAISEPRTFGVRVGYSY